MRLLHVLASIAMVSAYHGPDLPIGPFCGKGGLRGGCCTNREDRCSHKILLNEMQTMCYCDEFCNKHGAQDDCCPDYELVCLGQDLPPEPEPIIRGICELGHSKTVECNKCTCEEINGQPDWRCERDTCIIDKDVINDINKEDRFRRKRYTWRAANYTQFFNKKLKEGVVYKLGTFDVAAPTRRMNPFSYELNFHYPREFDATKKWSGFISPIKDQGWCGSDWAVTIASILSDRFAIQSKGAEAVELSPQSLLSCNRRDGQQACKGGNVDVAFNYVRDFGLVDEDCMPYSGSEAPCPYNPRGSLREAGCRPIVSHRRSKYKCGPTYRLTHEHGIMYDIMKSGPVLAVMTVYQDFFHYRDGIYRRSELGNRQLKGLHSVKIVGWGEEEGDPYWIVANSWGREWGENGYFRIARGLNESGIESFVISADTDVKEANRAK